MKEQRERAIEAMLARAAAETGKPTKSDAVLQHLEKIIAVRKAALNRAQELHETKSAIPKSDVQQTEADLAEAEIRAELRKEDLAKSQATAEAGRLAQQAHELHIEVTVTMDVSRYKVLGLKLSELRKARDMLDEHNRITEVELPALNRELLELRLHSIQSHRRPEAVTSADFGEKSDSAIVPGIIAAFFARPTSITIRWRRGASDIESGGQRYCSSVASGAGDTEVSLGRSLGNGAPDRCCRTPPGGGPSSFTRLRKFSNAAANTGSLLSLRSSGLASIFTRGDTPTESIGLPCGSMSIQRGRLTAIPAPACARRGFPLDPAVRSPTVVAWGHWASASANDSAELIVFWPWSTTTGPT
jgi:hypothetical protein